MLSSGDLYQFSEPTAIEYDSDHIDFNTLFRIENTSFQKCECITNLNEFRLIQLQSGMYLDVAKNKYLKSYYPRLVKNSTPRSVFRFLKVVNEKTLDTGDLIQQNVLVYIQNVDCNFYIGINNKNKD